MVRFKSVFQAALIAALLSVGVFAQQAPEAPPFQWPRSRDYDVQHYKIKVAFDWAKKEVAGQTTITLRPFKSDFRELELDAGEMKINSVKLASGKPLKFRYENNEKLFAALDRGYSPEEQLAVTVDYAASPKRGLVFVVPTESEPDRPHQIWTSGETGDNHYWFPCYDYPNDRATSEMIATADERYTVVSNGRLEEVRSDPSMKLKTWHWRMEQPFSSYLVSITVGEFAEIKDSYKSIPVISYVYRDQVENGRLSFGRLPQMVAFFSEKLGFEYPYAKYAQVTVRGFPGALENITATTMSDTIVRDARAFLDRSSDNVVSHELAHQWFGNMITCRDWGELWLNEGFATFFADVWAEHDKGKDEYLFQMRQNQQRYFGSWNRGARRPISVKRYADPDALFDVYSYQRAAAVINMLRFVLGEDLFWKAIRHYVDKYAWRSIETGELIVAIEEATGQNLQWFFDEWIYKMGHPQFEIVSNYDENARKLTLSVKQTQKPSEKAAWFQSPDFFTMPVDVAIATQSGEKVHRLWIDKREKAFEFAVDSKPLFINFDRGGVIIKEVKYDRPESEIAYQLLNDSDVIGRIQAAKELAGFKTETALKALSDAALRDGFYGVRLEAARALSGLAVESAKTALLETVKDKDARVRAEALKGLALFKDPKLADLYIGIINSDRSYECVEGAALALGLSRSPQAYGALSTMLERNSWQEAVRIAALSGLAGLKDPRMIDVMIEYARIGKPIALRRTALLALGEHGRGNGEALRLLLSALREKGSGLQFFAGQGLRALADPSALPELEKFSRDPDLRDSEKQLITSLINRIREANKINQ